MTKMLFLEDVDEQVNEFDAASSNAGMTLPDYFDWLMGLSRAARQRASLVASELEAEAQYEEDEL